MKKLFIVLCLLLACVPNMVYAKDKKINVYIFHGDGCPHCAKALEFFDSIEKEYGKYYNLVKYETWTSLFASRNNKMMKQVAEKFGDDSEKLGVPYIIIGDKTFLGYADSYKEDIKKAIIDAYNDDNYEDKVKPIINKMNNNLLTDLSIAGGFTVGLIGLVVLNFVLRSKLLKNN